MSDTLHDTHPDPHQHAVPDAPRFHLVVERPHREGPLGPYRFLLTVLFALLTAGLPLWRAAETGIGIDIALLRAAAAAALMWFLSGRVDRILAARANSPNRSGRDLD